MVYILSHRIAEGPSVVTTTPSCTVFEIQRVRPIIDTYKTAKIHFGTSTALDIIQVLIISTALDVPKIIFAVLCVNYGPYTLL